MKFHSEETNMKFVFEIIAGFNVPVISVLIFERGIEREDVKMKVLDGS